MVYEHYLESLDEEISALDGNTQLAIYRGLVLATRKLGRDNPMAQTMIDKEYPRRTEAADIEEPEEKPDFLEEWAKLKQLYQNIKGLKPQDNQ